MADEYFILIDNVQQGPFPADKLKSHGVVPDTLVWKKGFESWMKVREVTELRAFFPWQPPAKAKPAPSPAADAASTEPADRKPAPKKSAAKSGFSETIVDWKDKFLDLKPQYRYGIIGLVALAVIVPTVSMLFKSGTKKPKYAAILRDNTDQVDPKKKTLAKKDGKQPAVVGKQPVMPSKAGPADGLPAPRFEAEYYRLVRNLSFERLFAGAPLANRGAAVNGPATQVVADYETLRREAKLPAVKQLARLAGQYWKDFPPQRLPVPVATGRAFHPELVWLRMSGNAIDSRNYELELQQRKLWTDLLTEFRGKLDQSAASAPEIARLKLVSTGNAPKAGSPVELLMRPVTLAAVNTSGRTLHYCTLEVTLETPWGLKTTSHYYVETWKPTDQLTLTPGGIWGHDGLQQTTVASLTVWSHDAVQPRKRIRFSERFDTVALGALSHVERELEQGRFLTALKIAKGISENTEAGDSHRARARQSVLLAERLRRSHGELLALVVPDKEFTGRWWFGRFTGRISLMFERPELKVSPNVRAAALDPSIPELPLAQARAYDPKLPPQYKLFKGAITFDPIREMFVLRIKGAEIGVAGVAAGLPELRHLLLKSDVREFELIARDGELIGRTALGDRLTLIPTNDPKLDSRLAELESEKPGFTTPAVALRGAPLPVGVLPSLEEASPIGLTWGPAEIRRYLEQDQRTKRAVAFGPAGKNVTQVVFNGLGNRLYGVMGGTTVAWMTQTGKQDFRSNTGFPIDVSPNGRFIAVPSAAGTRLFAGNSGKRYPKRDFEAVVQGKRSSTIARFSPDGRRLITADRSGRMGVFVSGRRLMSVEHSSAVTAVGMSRDGTIAVSATADKKLNLWNLVDKGKFLGNLEGSESDVSEIHVSPDGRFVLTTSLVANRKPQGAAVRGQRTVAAPIRQVELQVWQVDSQRRVHFGRYGHNVTCMAISPDWRTAVIGETDGPISVWDLLRGRETQRLAGHTKPAKCVAISSDGRFAASGGSDGWVILWGLPEANPMGGSYPSKKPVVRSSKSKLPVVASKPLSETEKKRTQAMRSLRFAETALKTGRRADASKFLREAERVAGDDPLVRREIKRLRDLLL